HCITTARQDGSSHGTTLGGRGQIAPAREGGGVHGVVAGEEGVEVREGVDAPEDLAVGEDGGHAEGTGGDGVLGLAAHAIFGLGGARVAYRGVAVETGGACCG